MWVHDKLLMNTILENYDDKVQYIKNSVNNIDTGNYEMDVKLLRSIIIGFCNDWLNFSSSYKEAKEEDFDRAIKAIEEFNGNVNTAINNIALQRKLKDKSIDRSGANAPNYKSIDMEAMINDYNNGISTLQLVDKYGLSISTVINRLKFAGVYRDGRKNRGRQ